MLHRLPLRGLPLRAKRLPLALGLPLALACSFPTTFASADMLSIGDPAPKLVQGEYVKGEPVTEFESGKVYVLEFWATWCGPCVAAIPHVTELQQAHADDGLIVIGQNVWEQDESKVAPFVENMGDKMAYRVAMDDKSENARGAMANDFMAAAGRNGIPCSFIVDQEGRIAWIGHPMAMDEPLKQVLDGSYDIDAARAAMQKEQAYKQAIEEQYNPAYQNKEWAKALAATEQLLETFPDQAQDLYLKQYTLNSLLKDADGMYAAMEIVWPLVEENGRIMAIFAIGIMRSPAMEGHRDLVLAQKAAEKALALSDGNDPYLISFVAEAHFLQGNEAKAIEMQTQAVDVAQGGAKEQMQKMLDRFEGKPSEANAETGQ